MTASYSLCEVRSGEVKIFPLNLYKRSSVPINMKHPDDKIMLKAIKLARKEKGVAAIIVKGNKIIAQGTTSVYQDQQPFRHGEINAIEKACKKFQSFDLSGCWLYTTYEPCPMCASACVWARLEGIVYGASMNDRNKTYTQRILIPCKEVLRHGTPKVKLHEEFMRDKCKKLLLLSLKGKS